MRNLSMIAVTALVGVTGFACTDDGYYNARPQYVMRDSSFNSSGYSQPLYVNRRTYTSNGYNSGQPRYVQSASNYRTPDDIDGDGVPNWRDMQPKDPTRY